MLRSMQDAHGHILPDDYLVSSDEGTPKYASPEERALLARYKALFSVPDGPRDMLTKEHDERGNPRPFLTTVEAGKRRAIPRYKYHKYTRYDDCLYEKHWDKGGELLHQKLCALYAQTPGNPFFSYGLHHIPIFNHDQAMARIRQHLPEEYKQLRAPVRSWMRIQKDLEDSAVMEKSVPAAKARGRARTNLIEKAKEARARLQAHYDHWGGAGGEGGGPMERALARKWKKVTLPSGKEELLWQPDKHTKGSVRVERQKRERVEAAERSEATEARRKQNQEGRLKARLVAEKKRQKDMTARWKAQDEASSKARAEKRKRK
ncbi:hypothetical protein WJX74_010501 [Apatococcus lobatus]|uniref:Uncharacterized protein n=1 Tax=Apatococcus lobatus TaxID=904363 RepID=A0AAW1SFP7_9CHLO